jgi:inhibitor of cysteine peptidase
VKLKGNPTTGYTWETAEVDETILKPMGAAEFKPDRDAIGAGGTLTLHFKAVGEGTTRLRLIYHRPFEKNTPPIKSFEIDVEVK